MPHLVPTGRGATGGRKRSSGGSPMNSTSIYETHLGMVSLTWTRSLFSVSVSADLRLAGVGVSASTTGSCRKHGFRDEEEEEEEEEEDEEEREVCLNLRARVWLFWRRRGSKRFQFGRRCAEVAWDLRRARFPATGGPEPVSGFYVAIAVDREMLLIAGDSHEDAYKRTRLLRSADAAALVLRRENAVMRDYSYHTVARFAGMEREIAIQLSPEKGMVVGVNGDPMLRVKRLRWKFRGCKRVMTDDGLSIQISWDLHDWLFGPCVELSTREQTAHAKFVFKFEKPVGSECYEVKDLGCGYCARSNWSWSSSSEKGRKKSFSSMTSVTSTASSSVSSSVMEWTTAEEVEMRRGEAFSLLVYLWKRR